MGCGIGEDCKLGYGGLLFASIIMAPTNYAKTNQINPHTTTYTPSCFFFNIKVRINFNVNLSSLRLMIIFTIIKIMLFAQYNKLKFTIF